MKHNVIQDVFIMCYVLICTGLFWSCKNTDKYFLTKTNRQVKPTAEWSW